MPLEFSKLSVLVVDDNEFMRQLYRSILAAFDFRDDYIREATDGCAAQEELSTTPVDLAICDINMQPMDGIAFTRFVRTSPDSKDIFLPIIICTGHAEVSLIEAARDAGATEILRKPISPQSMYSRLQAIIDTPRSFINSPNYTGPDRRRRNVPFNGLDRRASEFELD